MNFSLRHDILDRHITVLVFSMSRLSGVIIIYISKYNYFVLNNLQIISANELVKLN